MCDVFHREIFIIQVFAHCIDAYRNQENASASDSDSRMVCGDVSVPSSQANQLKMKKRTHTQTHTTLMLNEEEENSTPESQFGFYATINMWIYTCMCDVCVYVLRDLLCVIFHSEVFFS